MIRTPARVREVDCRFTAPPSKSYTHRAMIIASLADGMSILHDPLVSQDTDLSRKALESLGTAIHVGEGAIRISGTNGHFTTGREITLDLGNSGTSLRLLASLALLTDHPVVLTGNARMQERPIGPLADALTSLGGKVEYLGRNGYPPIKISGSLKGGRTTVDGSVSSQFISSLLIAAPYADEPVKLELLATPVSRSYLDVTINIMRAFNARVFSDNHTTFTVSTRNHYQSRSYDIEGDFSSSSYFFAIAALCGGRVEVKNLNPLSVQGDRQFTELLRLMGCTVSETYDSISVERSGDLRGIEVDMSPMPDTVQTLCVVAAMASTPTIIRGISHLKFKESDRIIGTAERLNSLGGDVRVEPDSITIRPVPLHGGTINPADDHRTAMSFAVLGLAVGGIRIEDADCVNKSFPGFWEALSRAGL